MTDLAFEEAFASAFSLAYRVAFRVTGSSPESEEVAQETLSRAFVHWSRISRHVEPWVATVAFRLATDVLRKNVRHPTTRLADSPAPAVDHDRRLDLSRALSRLSRRQKEVLVHRYLLGFSDSETASALDISPGAVKRHAARGLASLRRDTIDA
jgi:RNA polymerase sigma factor (sigma-70 family)